MVVWILSQKQSEQTFGQLGLQHLWTSCKPPDNIGETQLFNVKLLYLCFLF